MHIIPVIDLMHGQVVQAIQGQRQSYRAIQSQLTASHQLLDVVAAILQVYPFDCVYIADLNAITGDTLLPNHSAYIAEAIQAFPHIQWWVDAGLTSVAALTPWLDNKIRPVIASESLPDLPTYQQLRHAAENSILSLDYFQDGFHGPESLQTSQIHWTQPTIVMSLPKVGANQGPDVEKLHAMKQKTPQKLYAAGGVRDIEDIRALTHTGADGVLIASALHQKKITAADLHGFAQ
ncbi:MAG: HisA/HisF-related TIM barrel protein [Methylophilus sp.]|uniref:HisA/HisF-related TIM barrel protein n=1 Tax=Methylophilus sp. TaxID=29541 RepID=UPI003FA06604